jgi:hypothetical protein
MLLHLPEHDEVRHDGVRAEGHQDEDEEEDDHHAGRNLMSVSPNQFDTSFIHMHSQVILG